MKKVNLNWIDQDCPAGRIQEGHFRPVQIFENTRFGEWLCLVGGEQVILVCAWIGGQSQQCVDDRRCSCNSRLNHGFEMLKMLCSGVWNLSYRTRSVNKKLCDCIVLQIDYSGIILIEWQRDQRPGILRRQLQLCGLKMFSAALVTCENEEERSYLRTMISCIYFIIKLFFHLDQF